MPERTYPTSTSRRVRIILMATLLLAGSLSIWAEATARIIGAMPATTTAISTLAQAGVATTGQATRPLGSMLNADGTLNQSTGFSGSLDASGWQMVSAAGEPPRFVASDSKVQGQSNPDQPEASGDQNWDGRFGLGTSGTVYAIAVSGNDTYVGGTFTQAGSNNVAMWNSTTQTWSPLDTGTNGVVRALAVSGSDVYAGGNFSQAGEVGANNVAKWNGSAWSALGSSTGNGTDGEGVYSLAALGSNVYVGGAFTIVGGEVGAIAIAKWNGTVWSSLGSGATGYVYALAVSADGHTLYVGGSFQQAGGLTVNQIAQWSITNSTWGNLGTGTNNRGTVLALAVSGTDLYMGGDFLEVGGLPAYYVAKWSTTNSTWSVLGPEESNGTDGSVYSLAVSGTDVYVGGMFNQTAGHSTHNIAKWSSTSGTWSYLGVATSNGTDGTVDALVVSGSDVYAGGGFTTASGLVSPNIAKWSSTYSKWSPLGNGLFPNGANGFVLALAVSGSDVYVGGLFTQAGEVNANNIAMWDGTSWSSLGSSAINGTNGYVLALAVSGSDLYVSGRFTQAGEVNASNIAMWDGTLWSPLGSGVGGAEDNLYALAVEGNDVYVGGLFTQAGGVNANNIAMWDGTSWSPLGSSAINGTDSYVLALAVSGNDLYVGGQFTQVVELSANNIAKWNGSAWSALGSGTGNGTNGAVIALAASESNIYMGGLFSMTGEVDANHIAMWNSTNSTWSALGSGTNDRVNAVVVSGSEVYVGGSFTQAGGASANNVAMWDGSTWSPLGSGANQGYYYMVYPLALSGNNLYVGGDFATAGGNSSLDFAIWHIPAPQCTLQFEDVPNPSTFYAYVQCLACKGIINGYACGGAGEPCNSNNDPYFRPSHNVTRGQIAKTIALSADLHTPISGQTFEDVPPGSTFYTYTEQLYAVGAMNGYPCGGAGEPCNAPNNRPYFRPGANATRGQLAKIDANAAEYNDTPTGQTFQDVAIASTFYTFTQRLTSRGVMSGYTCGGAGEPCGPGSLPYFRPRADVTRGQTSKIVGNTFFPNCQTPHY